MAGKKTFVAGEVLLAQDVNDFLMDQTVMNFASAAARASAIPTPTEGMTTYVQDRNQIETFDGAEYRGMSGLQLVKKQAIGTAVASVTVTDAFSATYENYKIIINGGLSSAQILLYLSLGATNTGYYSARTTVTWASTTVSGQNTSNGSAFLYAGNGGADGLFMDADIYNPFTSKKVIYKSISVVPSITGNTSNSGGILDNTTSYTAFTVEAATGTLTGGTIYVYGYGT
jgi:hypothetical protein